MSAAETLAAAQAAGVRLGLDGADLLIESDRRGCARWLSLEQNNGAEVNGE